MGNNPSSFKDCGDECPVESVSWYDAQVFIKWLNHMEGKDRYRMPTEAEWEHACRAGTSTLYNIGACISTDQANYNGNYPLSGCPKGVYRKRTIKTGSFSPNSWGLYDIHGNVWEWCQDWYGTYPKGDVKDPVGPFHGRFRVLRGGSWYTKAKYVRSANRNIFRPNQCNYLIGFRVVRDF